MSIIRLLSGVVGIVEMPGSSLSSNTRTTFHGLWLHAVRHCVVYLGIGIFLATVVILLAAAAKENKGHVVYALDDAYIHMAMAKNLAQHGVFGVTQYEFSSSSSSILWTLLLSASFWVFGTNEVTPLILNIILASALLVLIYLILRKYQLGSLACLIVLLAVIYFAPLPLLVLIGMEHVLQAFINVAFVFVCATLLENPYRKEKLFYFSILLSALVTMVRFEGVFLVFAVCFLYVVQKKPMNALLIGLAGISPVLLFGIFSLHNNWLFFPNSVVIKGNFPDLHSVKGIFAFMGLTCYRQLARNPHILIILTSIMFFIIKDYGRNKTIYKNRLTLMSALSVVATLLHLQFAQTGWFYRYESYIVIFGLLLTGVFLNAYYLKLSQDKVLRCLLLITILVASSPFGVRAIEGLKLTPRAMVNIYQQQYQMGLFLNKFYKGTSIAANDIGAISYLGDNRLLDVFGLASLEVGKAVKEGSYNTELIDNLSRKNRIKIAVVYENYGKEYVGNAGIPSNWRKVGEWTISNNIVCREDTVAFFAVNSYEAEVLANNLKAFSASLPPEVGQRIYE